MAEVTQVGGGKLPAEGPDGRIRLEWFCMLVPPGKGFGGGCHVCADPSPVPSGSPLKVTCAKMVPRVKGPGEYQLAVSLNLPPEWLGRWPQLHTVLSNLLLMAHDHAAQAGHVAPREVPHGS